MKIFLLRFSAPDVIPTCGVIPAEAGIYINIISWSRASARDDAWSTLEHRLSKITQWTE